MPNDDFFVGYLATPPYLRAFLRKRVAVFAIGAIVVAAALAGLQRDVGTGKWDLDHISQVQGIIREHPYPMMETEGRDRALLLVSEGKMTASQAIAGLDGKVAKISGSLIDRNGMSMLELQSGSPVSAIDSPNGLTANGLAASNTMKATLIGEIVDSKCFLGAMKPGDGKTHKACASLCIRGGIPPMLICFDSKGQRTDYLLTNSVGDGLAGAELDAILPYVGDRVEMIGEVTESGATRLFRLSSVGAIRRL